MSNRRKSRRERRQQQILNRTGRCADGRPHDWQVKAGYGVVCSGCGAKQAPR